MERILLFLPSGIFRPGSFGAFVPKHGALNIPNPIFWAYVNTARERKRNSLKPWSDSFFSENTIDSAANTRDLSRHQKSLYFNPGGCNTA